MVSLITYADRLAGDLIGLHALLDGELNGLFSGVHVLPFYTPIDGADAGFDPVDHLAVDHRIGSWSDITAIASSYAVMADMIVNHMSADSMQFLDVLRRGRASPYWSLFLRKEDLFPADDDLATAEGLSKLYRPRPGVPLVAKHLDDGEMVNFWATFSAKQIDINVESPAGQDYLASIFAQSAKVGVSHLRLDAAGYAIKRAGTSCFMLPETYDFIESLSNQARQLGIETLVEVHSYYKTQCEIASRVDWVYDFALPPLILHSLYNDDARALKHWLSIAPRNCVTVLDTHDGIGIIDVGPHGDRPGLLTADQIDHLVESIHLKTDGKSRQASGHAASNLDIYQVNSTYYDALGACDIDYLIARAIQFFAPGRPQVYYVGLFAGGNDLELVGQTGAGRDINRHYYSAPELREATARSVVQELFALIRLRNALTVFDGDFAVVDSSASELVLEWSHGEDQARLSVDLEKRSALITGNQAGGAFQYEVGKMAGYGISVAV